MRTKIKIKLHLIEQGSAELSNVEFEKLLDTEKANKKDSKIGQGLREIENAIETAIS